MARRSVPPRKPVEPSEEELRPVRLLLHDAATHDEAPKRDLVRGAVKRLAFRRRSITNVNEFFGALRAIVRGFVTLMSVEEPDGPSHG